MIAAKKILGTPQYHPPKADKSAGATPEEYAPLSQVNSTGHSGAGTNAFRPLMFKIAFLDKFRF